MSESSVLASAHPLVAHKLAKLRSRASDPKRFRELIREIAALLTYEATLDLRTRSIELETPMARATGAELTEKVGLAPPGAPGWEMVEVFGS
jgi:uracil phosphoribosyltransferase